MMRIVLIAVAFYLVYAGVAFLLQRRLMYPGTFMSPVREVRADSLPGVEQLWLDNGGGRSEAWLLNAATTEGAIPEARPQGATGPDGDAARASPDARPGPVVLFFHGNGDFIDDWIGPFRGLAERGVHVLLVEYPGYGRSTGSPTEESIMRTAVSAYDRLADREDVDPDRIVAMGRSLGGGVAAELVLRRPAAALVLQSAFTSVGALAARAYFIPPFLARDRFAPLEVLRSWEGPVLVLHGREDRIVPYSHGERLAETAGDATLVSMECGHNDCPPSFDDYWDRIVGFLEEENVIRPPRR
ncbi:MAG: alpha/beta hydrolase [Gemmatimonadota bacterium]